ncbi:hypothetical protein PIIN_09850 [Serendipita indica DSM 11827]|uniref:Uncharacterized protein n=1 Tax=Serendipita indica (strain DSM 11827) TaxID=1109443 RepID=G4TX12_SERID|nr:hypothetical protein PIIN_09850 [Serendipita indica DSM 11827]
MASERDLGVESDDENPTIFVEFLPKAPVTLELVSRKGSDEMMFHIGSKPSDKSDYWLVWSRRDVNVKRSETFGARLDLKVVACIDNRKKSHFCWSRAPSMGIGGRGKRQGMLTNLLETGVMVHILVYEDGILLFNSSKGSRNKLISSRCKAWAAIGGVMCSIDTLLATADGCREGV